MKSGTTSVRGHVLREYRERHGLEVGEFAALLGADRATLFRWEREWTSPPGCLPLALAELERRIRRAHASSRVARAKRIARRRAADPSDPRYW